MHAPREHDLISGGSHLQTGTLILLVVAVPHPMSPHLLLLRIHQVVVTDPPSCHRSRFLRRCSSPIRRPSQPPQPPSRPPLLQQPSRLHQGPYRCTSSMSCPCRTLHGNEFVHYYLHSASSTLVNHKSDYKVTSRRRSSPESRHNRSPAAGLSRFPGVLLRAPQTLHTDFCAHAVLHLILLCALQ
jgi:hypothetical protein